MKQAIIFIMIVSILLSVSCSEVKTASTDISVPIDSLTSSDASSKGTLTESTPSNNTSSNDLSNTERDELRGVWISYSEMGNAFKGDFYKNIDAMMDNIKNLGFNTAYVHVRAFCDSFYSSELFPWSSYITGEQGISPGFDPLDYIIKSGKERNIEIHAWINPYRVSYSTEDPYSLSEKNPVRKYMAENPNSTFAVGCDGGLYLNPANDDANKLIIDGVKEIINKYDVDGIHFDDYFYPTMDESFDTADYLGHKVKNKNPLSLADWRRENVNQMLKTVYNEIKKKDKSISFGISPAGNNERNYNELYADIGAWVKGGYVDYIIPQLYFGYNYRTERFQYDKLVKEWTKYNSDVTLYAGLGAYKIGNASGTEKDEWSSGCLMEKMINHSREYKYDGFVIFSYSSLFSNDKLNTEERNRIFNLIGDN